MPLSPHLSPVSYATLPNWQYDRHADALHAFRRSAVYALSTPYKTGNLGLEAASYCDAYHASQALSDVDDPLARTFFETCFVPFRVLPKDGSTGLVTGFYEPEAEASAVQSERFQVPLLAPPYDLVKVDDSNRPAGLDPYLAYGRFRGSTIIEYHERAEIESGVLGDRARPIAWLEHKVDAFFIHVQGAARLQMADGRLIRITYAAKSGQRFTGPGHVLTELGEIPREEVTMQSIRAWFRRNPHRIDEILHRNRSYIFFREAPVDDPTLGPVAAAKVPLTAGRSMAVDRLHHTFGSPIYVSSPGLSAFGGARFDRLMIAQDTGSAIVGLSRGDLFTGSGNAAGEIAGVIRHAADFFVLVPRTLVGTR